MPIPLKKIKFLKYIIGKNKIYINLAKIAAAKEWSILINIKKSQSFLKFINFNRKFIKEYLKHIKALIQLIKKDEMFI